MDAADKKNKEKEKPSCHKGVLFYIGLVSAVYNAVVHTGIVANVNIPWWVGAIGVALSAVLMYCNGKTPAVSANDVTAAESMSGADGASGTDGTDGTE